MPEAVLPAPFGSITVQARNDGTVTSVKPRTNAADRHVDPDFPAPVLAEFEAYIRDGTHHPNVAVELAVPGFRGKVLEAMQRIPPGRVATYGELAERAGSPNAARAAGSACASNPAAIVVPCHRVVGVTGLGGYSGGGLDVKRWLLRHEGIDPDEL